MWNISEPFRQTYSLKKRLLLIICVLFGCFLIVITGIDVYFTSILRRDMYKAVKDNLGIYCRQLNEQLRALEIYLFEVNDNNVDVSLLGNSSNNENYNELIHVKTLLTNALPSFSEIDGLFVYSVSSDYFVTKYKNVENYSAAYSVRRMLKDSKENGTLEEIDTRSWFIRKIGNDYYFIRIIRTGNSCIGAWVNTKNLTSPFQSISGYRATVFYADQNGIPLIPNAHISEQYNPRQLEKKYSVLKRDDGIKYVSAAVSVDFCNCWLLAFIPLADIDRQLFSVDAIMIGLILAIIISTPFIIFSLNRLWTVPLVRLHEVAETLHSGTFDARISVENAKYTEFLQVYNTFNEMIDEIQKLRIRVYEERIAKSEFELQYLKSQIAPHFLINCLTSISSLVMNTENEMVIQNMIACLTNHLRYTLSGKTYVSLSEELQYVENYVELARLRAPGSLIYTEDIEPPTENAKVFPLILLMLTENTLKYNLIAGEKLAIRITASMVQGKNGQNIHLTHLDSGDGFSSDVLQQFSHLKRGESEHGSHIGLYNVLKRLELTYDNEAFINISNEPGWGARIDIEIPYLPYGKDSSLGKVPE